MGMVWPVSSDKWKAPLDKARNLFIPHTNKNTLKKGKYANYVRYKPLRK